LFILADQRTSPNLLFILAESAHEGREMSAADGCKPARPNVDSGLKGRQKHSGVDADYFTSPVTKEHLYNVRGQHRASHMGVM
jgi:hypothetical protein